MIYLIVKIFNFRVDRDTKIINVILSPWWSMSLKVPYIVAFAKFAHKKNRHKGIKVHCPVYSKKKPQSRRN